MSYTALRNINKLEAIVNDFIDSFGCSGEIGLDFAYYPNTEEIVWSIVSCSTSDALFQEFVNDNYPNIQADTFLWSLLHEIGHHMTYLEWTNDELRSSIEIKDFAQAMLAESESYETERISHFIYFSAPDEKRATEWAASYMLRYEEEILSFWHNFVEAYNEFLTLNQIER